MSVNKVEEIIAYIFINCDLAFNVWSIMDTHCPNPMNTNSTIIDWPGYIWNSKNLYNKIYENSLKY